MMDQFKKRRTANIFIIILIIMNITLLAAFWYKFIRTPSGSNDAVRVGREPFNSSSDSDRFRVEERFKKFLKDELNFSTEQHDKFMELQHSHLEKIRVSRRQIDDLRKTLMDKLVEDKIDEENINGIVKEIGDKTSSHEKSVFYHFLELSKICNKEQKVKYRKLMREILEKLKPKPQPPAGNRPPPPDHMPPPHH